ncbi:MULTISPECIES: Fic family protein [unclassified Halomonas]|uniref:Fic family protein n=1 Tax=unclassified Halomonas TaxID=2609666 RepID=UPI0007D9C2D3|nr:MULTISPECIES: Fic family protein [unclassified Halomonas]MBT2786752.1 Fic family protein [Halomonas sp. ISL-106]MBT2798595.1 Fic family protein [Halomonas sp. ISL-104]OAL58039.1 hypothetical protein A6R74_09385 [Halomonas sp. ALS9]
MNPYKSGKPLTSEQLQALEATYTWQRIVALRLNPVVGNFDAAHLKEINRRIFQDLPSLGFVDAMPGVFRPTVAPGKDWIKSRHLESIGITSNVAYSSMDKAAQVRLNEVLEGANLTELSSLETNQFTQAIGRLYVEVDYIHPFADGNSRTLREFTRQLAEASGYILDWGQFGSSSVGRDVLYIARDLSVNQLALPNIQNLATKRDVMLSVDQLGGNRDLPDLLRDAVRLL